MPFPQIRYRKASVVTGAGFGALSGANCKLTICPFVGASHARQNNVEAQVDSLQYLKVCLREAFLKFAP